MITAKLKQLDEIIRIMREDGYEVVYECDYIKFIGDDLAWQK